MVPGFYPATTELPITTQSSPVGKMRHTLARGVPSHRFLATVNLKIELDYDYWDPKVEGDAFSKRHLKPNVKTPPDQISSYFDLDSWVLLTIRFNPH